MICFYVRCLKEGVGARNIVKKNLSKLLSLGLGAVLHEKAKI